MIKDMIMTWHCQSIDFGRSCHGKLAAFILCMNDKILVSYIALKIDLK